MGLTELYGTEEVFAICHEIYNISIVYAVFDKLVNTIIYPSHLDNVHNKSSTADILLHI